MKIIQTLKITIIFLLFLLIRLIILYIFFFLEYKTSRAIVILLFSNFFQSTFSGGKFIPSQSYLFMNGLIFVILYRSFLISSWFNATVTVYWNICYHFYWWNLLFFLFFNQSGKAIWTCIVFGYLWTLTPLHNLWFPVGLCCFYQNISIVLR